MKIFTEEQESLFERIFVNEHGEDRDHNCSASLSNEEYISYYIWEDINFDSMMLKHFPKTFVIRGINPNIIFHGGCLGCASQRKHGIDRCEGCMYFRADWDKSTLFIEGEESAKLDQKGLDDLLNNAKDV